MRVLPQEIISPRFKLSRFLRIFILIFQINQQHCPTIKPEIKFPFHEHDK
jgi:hypothetical protein